MQKDKPNLTVCIKHKCITHTRELRRRCTDRLLLRGTRNDVNAILGNHNEILGNLKNLLNDGSILLLRSHKHLLLRACILAQKRLALRSVVKVIEHNWLILLNGNPCSVCKCLHVRKVDLGRN